MTPATTPGGELVMSPGAHGATRIRSAALDFIEWGTTRKPWRDYCEVTGDARSAEPFLDCLNFV